jgi:hypothetical protein
MGKGMTDINNMINAIREFEKHGLPVDDPHKIAEIAFKESYKCTDTYHGSLMYLMALELMMQYDDGK